MRIEDCINYLFTGAQHTVFQEMKNSLKQFEITPVQYGVLCCIWQKGMSNPKEIADFLGIENSTISGILERMEAKELISREINVEDRRYIKIFLTDRAKEMEEPVCKVVEEVNMRVLEPFSEAEKALLKEYLRKIKG